MKTKLSIYTALVVLLIGGVVYLHIFVAKNRAPVPVLRNDQPTEVTKATQTEQRVVFNESGFAPNETAGGEITIINETEEPILFAPIDVDCTITPGLCEVIGAEAEYTFIPTDSEYRTKDLILSITE